MWVEHSKMLMNEYRLNPLDPNSQKIMDSSSSNFSSAKAPSRPRNSCRLLPSIEERLSLGTPHTYPSASGPP